MTEETVNVETSNVQDSEAGNKHQEKQVTEKQVEETKKVETSKNAKVAVILVRGLTTINKKIKDTLLMLRLTRKNNCVVVDNNPATMGMIRKVKDYVTWGEIDDSIFKEIVDKRGEEFKGRTEDGKKKYSYKCLDINGKKYKPYFRLNPPRKGFGRKGVKMPFKLGGALGDRSDKMSDLIKRML
jgi:large subunit ribosomal protein L30